MSELSRVIPYQKNEMMCIGIMSYALITYQVSTYYLSH